MADSSYEVHDEMITTPRPTQTSFLPSSSYATDEQPAVKTPTRDTFPTFSGQLPPQETPASISSYDASPRTRIRKSSTEHAGGSRSAQPARSANGTSTATEVDDGSDAESMNSDGRPAKKKKAQRFYCTDYPPCNLSFTRSEHLARHIRKHTGERPFQCHCMRRFSRLDNLRQHAQTVHLNEDIPIDSLAATGTRFQRQVRTDRIRPGGGGRARASTIGSQPPMHARGHSRNISTSSVGSTSDFSTGVDPINHQSQQQATAMHVPMGPPQSTVARGGLGLDTYNAGGPEHPYYPYYTQNTGYSSPNSVYSTDHSSPLAHTGLQSPISMVPRGMSWVDPGHGRRMSFPSASTTMQSPSTYGSNMTYMSPLATSSNAPTFSHNSMITSPTSSTFSDHHDFSSDVELKRRTWHPTSSFSSYEQRPTTSGLSYYQTPDAPRPMPSTQSAAMQNDLRLPGISSFDRSSGKPIPNAMNVDPTSPMDVDSPSKFSAPGDPSSYPVGNFYNRMQRPHLLPQQRVTQSSKSASQDFGISRDTQGSGETSPTTPRKVKRQAWYNGPVAQAVQTTQDQMMSTSPAGSSGSEAPHTPVAINNPEYQPAIMHSNGMLEPLSSEAAQDPFKSSDIVNSSRNTHGTMHGRQRRSDDMSPSRSSDMDRLDALVAVATSETQAPNSR